MHGVIACWLAGCGGWLACWVGWLRWAGCAGWLGGLAALAGLLAGWAGRAVRAGWPLGMHLSLFVPIWVLGLVLQNTVGPSVPI